MAAGWPLLVALALPALPGAADTGVLRAQAAASGRPRVCPAAGKRLNVWQRLRSPKRASYCENMALAQARLAIGEHGALEAVIAAESDLPGQADTAVLEAQILLSRNQAAEGLLAFEKALERDENAIDNPRALRAYAHALSLAGKHEAAAANYRILVPQAGLLAGSERPEVLLEAAFASMAAFEAQPEKTSAADGMGDGLSAALAYLQEARSDPTSHLVADALLASALVIDRQGDAARASALAKEAALAGAGLRSEGWVSLTREREALAALVAESSDPAAALAHWESYLTESKGKRFAAAALARVAELKKRGAPGSKAKPKPRPR